MAKLHIVWSVEKAQAISAPMRYADAARMADEREDATKKPFLVLPAVHEPSPAL